MATSGKVPTLGFGAGTIGSVTLFGFGSGTPSSHTIDEVYALLIEMQIRLNKALTLPQFMALK